MSSTVCYKKAVIKIGTSLLADSKGRSNLDFFRQLVDEVCELCDEGRGIVLVSSGAIASGMSVLGLRDRPTKLNRLQAVASVGQSHLMRLYNDFFQTRNRLCGQVLLTWDDFENRKRYINAKHTLLSLLECGVVPVVNENDTVSVEEIKFGDNDRLSALVANCISADMLIILSDVEGLYHCVPSRIKEGTTCEPLRIVKEITPEIERLAKGRGGRFTSGGMVTKLEAAKIATHFGIPCVLAQGKEVSVVRKILRGEQVGTLFLPHKEPLGARKMWIAFGTRPKGGIIVDPGAKKAILEKKCSLLSPGVTGVEGDFKKGEIVIIQDQHGQVVARGIASFSSEDLKKFFGKRAPREVVHRDYMVVVK